jgi:hypothetical protein
MALLLVRRRGDICLISLCVSEDSVAIDNQLKIFESCEQGLLATWGTPGTLICVPRFQT